MAPQFSDFYSSLDSDPLKRGKQFEYFVKWFLKADPEWTTQVDQVWLWDEWPHRWGADCGIDLVFKHKNGDHWAVQAKCYSPDYDITKHDVDKFLSESNRPLIQHRLLIATTDRIGNNQCLFGFYGIFTQNHLKFLNLALMGLSTEYPRELMANVVQLQKIFNRLFRR